MAKPPEPLAEMLPLATLVVVATVKRVVSTGAAQPPLPEGDHKVDAGARSPEQRLELEVERVLKGAYDIGRALSVTKPIAGYAVREGTKGAWLIDANGIVLGRYGPDSWRLQQVEAALA